MKGSVATCDIAMETNPHVRAPRQHIVNKANKREAARVLALKTDTETAKKHVRGLMTFEYGSNVGAHITCSLSMFKNEQLSISPYLCIVGGDAHQVNGRWYVFESSCCVLKDLQQLSSLRWEEFTFG